MCCIIFLSKYNFVYYDDTKFTQTFNKLNILNAINITIVYVRYRYFLMSIFLFQNANIPIENTTETLSTMAKVCLRMLESP